MVSSVDALRRGNEELGLPSWNDLAYHMFGLLPSDFPQLVTELAANEEVAQSSVLFVDDDIYFYVLDADGNRAPPPHLPPWVEPKLRDVWGAWNTKTGYRNPVDPFGKLQSDINRYVSLFGRKE